MKSKPSRVCFVLDTELAWGYVQRRECAIRGNRGVYDITRECVRTLLSACDSLDVPMTWAIVGAMATDPHEIRVDHLPQAAQDAIIQALADHPKEWFDGRDIVEDVVNAQTSHEIATHSYSHVPFNFPGYTTEAIHADVNLGIQALVPWQVRPSSLVCPEDRPISAESLSGSGIQTIRVNPRYAARQNRFYRLARRLHPPAARIDQSAGRTFVTASSYLYAGEGDGPKARIVRLATHSILRRLSTTNSDFVIWVHPYNFGEDLAFFKWFQRMLSRFSALRDLGHASFVSLGELAKHETQGGFS